MRCSGSRRELLPPAFGESEALISLDPWCRRCLATGVDRRQTTRRWSHLVRVRLLVHHGGCHSGLERSPCAGGRRVGSIRGLTGDTALPAGVPRWRARSWQRRRAKKLQRATQACGTGKSWPTSKKIRLLPAQSVQFGGGRSWRLLKRSKTIAGSTEVERMRDRRGVSPFRLPLSPRRLATRSARPGPGENAGGASGASGASET